MADEEFHIIRQFAQLATQIMELTGTGPYAGAPARARGMTTAFEHRFRSIAIKPETYHKPEQADLDLAEEIRESFREQMKERGEAARKAALIKCADDITEACAALWRMGPGVLVEADKIANELRREAEGDGIHAAIKPTTGEIDL